MSAAEQQDFGLTALLAPIAGGTGSGEDLRLTPTYRRIIDARREENPNLPQGIWSRDVKRADWPLVEKLCAEALLSRSKDVQLACWLTEARMRRGGPAGLAEGLRLLAGLCRRFWPSLYPAIDEDDPGPRIAPFAWMNAHFPALLRAMPIVRAANEPDRFHSWTDFVNAQLLEGLRQRDARSVERSEAAGAVSLKAFTELRKRTDTGFLTQLDAGLRDAAEALNELDAVLTERCGSEAPGLGAIGGTIAEMRGMTGAELAERRRMIAIPPAPRQARPPQQESPPPAETPTRDWLYEQLGALARHLETMEPHSPVPHLIARAVAWGQMPLPELLAEFGRTGVELGAVFSLLGLEQYGGHLEEIISTGSIDTSK